MKALLSIGIGILCLCAFESSAFTRRDVLRENVSQSSPKKAAKPRKAQAKGKEKADMAVRQQQALWTLASIEEKAKKLDGSILKVKILTKVAETLWQYDESRARLLFVAAFDAIDSIKLDAEKDQRVRMAAASGGLDPLADLRAEVLLLIAARDFKLAEKLWNTVKEPTTEAGGADNQQAELSEKEELAWDMAIASAKTQPERTAQFVRTQLRKGIHETLGLALISIRRENQPLAEQLFGEALLVARANLAAPESLETLAIYVLPTEEKTFHEQISASVPARRNFLSYVSDRLATQLATGQVIAPQTAQHEYRTLQSLLPLFDTLAPGKAPLVRERMVGLLSAMLPRQTDATLSRQDEDVLELLRQAESTVGSRRRDVRLIQVSMIASRQGDLEQAISIAERISDLEERGIQISLLAYQGSLKALAKGDTDGAYRLMRRINFLPQQVMAYTRLANKLRDLKEYDRARAVLEESWESANKPANSPQKAGALLTLITAMTPYDSERGFEMLASTVKTISGTDFSLTETNATPSRVVQVTLDRLDLGTVFSNMSRLDSDRAMQAAQSLTHLEASLLAQAIVCQHALAFNHRLQTQKSNSN